MLLKLYKQIFKFIMILGLGELNLKRERSVRISAEPLYVTFNTPVSFQKLKFEIPSRIEDLFKWTRK